MRVAIVDKGTTALLVTVSTLDTLHLVGVEYTGLPVLFLVLCEFLVEVHILPHFHHDLLARQTVAPPR